MIFISNITTPSAYVFAIFWRANTFLHLPHKKNRQEGVLRCILCRGFDGRTTQKCACVLQVPNSTYRPPKEIQKIEEIKKKNQQKTKVQMFVFTTIDVKCLWHLMGQRWPVIFVLYTRKLVE